MIEIKTDVNKLIVRPTPEEVKEIFAHAPHVAEKILRHLSRQTGRAEAGETECLAIATLDYNPYYVQVIYDTLKRNGKKGSQFMRFYYFTEAMRCLAVTEDARVVMIREFRRTRGEWVQMLPAGGAKAGKVLEVMVRELFAEAGARLTDGSRVVSLGRRYMDDGIFSERLNLLAADRLHVDAIHSNEEECISGTVLVPWREWRANALDGMYDDVFCELLAGRCTYDFRAKRIRVRGKTDVLVKQQAITTAVATIGGD